MPTTRLSDNDTSGATSGNDARPEQQQQQQIDKWSKFHSNNDSLSTLDNERFIFFQPAPTLIGYQSAPPIEDQEDLNTNTNNINKYTLNAFNDDFDINRLNNDASVTMNFHRDDDITATNYDKQYEQYMKSVVTESGQRKSHRQQQPTSSPRRGDLIGLNPYLGSSGQHLSASDVSSSRSMELLSTQSHFMGSHNFEIIPGGLLNDDVVGMESMHLPHQHPDKTGQQSETSSIIVEGAHNYHKGARNGQQLNSGRNKLMLTNFHRQPFVALNYVGAAEHDYLSMKRNDLLRL